MAIPLLKSIYAMGIYRIFASISTLLLTIFSTRVEYLTKSVGYLVDYFTWVCKMRCKMIGEIK